MILNRYFAWFGLRGSLVLTILLSLFALILALIFPNKARWICFVAMVLSSIGDVFLMHFTSIERLLPFPSFFAGAFAFMLSHIVYIIAFSTEIRIGGYRFVNPGFYIGLGIVLATMVTVFTMALRQNYISPIMVSLCFVYAVIIGANCVTIFSYAWSVRSWRSIAALGALSFFISDLIIGLNKLLIPIPSDWSNAIWWFYPIGQILILLGG